MDARRSIEAVWRIECPRLVASLARLLGEVGLAEEVAQDAFVAALEQWPRDGVPDRPGAWLHHRAAHLAGEAHPVGDGGSVRGPAGGRAGGPPVSGARGRYLIFNEGYAASSGEAWIRRDLAREAMRLGRVLAGLLPREPEVHGLVALMELQASRFGARTTADGSPVLLSDQDRTRWDRTLITHGLAALDRAAALHRPLGPYAVQAAIAACHARARSFEETDWNAIVALYDALAQLTPSPVVELNRAVAVLHGEGPEAALAALDAIAGDPRLAGYHLFGAIRADVLLRLGRDAEANVELRRAAALAPTERERELLRSRAS